MIAMFRFTHTPIAAEQLRLALVAVAYPSLEGGIAAA